MKRILPIILALFGLAAGIGAGYFLKPGDQPEKATKAEPQQAEGPRAPGERKPPSEAASATHAPGATSEKQPSTGDAAGPVLEYVKLDNQFVVPVVDGQRVSALVVLSLGMEVTQGNKELVFNREPRLRDALLQALFRHANSGGFDGKFTSGQKMMDLRSALLEAAHKVLGAAVTSVLIDDIVRQDV